MSRVLLIHWNAGEAEDRASILRQAGHEVDCHAEQGSAALRAVREHPAVPGMMDYYSGTPLPKKLGIKSNSFLTLLGAPADFERTLGRLPEGVSIRKQARGRSDVVLLFVRSGAELEHRFQAADRSLEEGGRLWIIWPKKASGIFSDLTQVSVRAFGLGVGYVDYKISAIDKTWSGLCFARRRS